MPVRIGRRLFAPSLYAIAATVAALTGFAGLGFWQLDRAAEKRALLAEYANGQRTMVALAAASAAILPRYQRVTADGRFDATRQVLLDNMPSGTGAPGYQVLTPFLLDGGGIVLVNRGWIPLGRNRNELPALDVGEESRRIEGMMDRLPVPGMRLAAVEAAASWPRVLNFPEYGELAEIYGAQLIEPVLLLDPKDADGFARDWSARVGIGPLRHVGYAIQWFALGVALIVIFVVVNLKPPAGPR